MEEKISSELILADLRIDSFRRSLGQLHTFASSFLSLNLQWQELEDHYASMKDEVKQRLEEVRSIEEKLEDIGRREGELNALRVSAEERLREVEAREREFELIQEKEIEELKGEFELIERSRREVEAVSESIEAKTRLVEEKEDSVEEKLRLVRETEKQVGVAWKEIEIKEGESAKLRDELKLKEERIVERSKILAMENDRLSRWELDLNSKGKELEEKRKESVLEAEKLESKMQQIQDKCEKVEQDQKKLVERFQEVELKEKRIQDKYEKVELEEKKLDERIREVELKEKMCQKNQMEKKKLVQQRIEVELEEKKLAERCREVELKEKQNQEMHQKFEMEKKKLAQQRQEVELEERKLVERCREVELKEKQNQEMHQKFEMEKKKLAQQSQEVEREEKKLAERCLEVELKEKQNQEMYQKFEMEKKKLAQQCQEIVLKQKELDQKCSEFESKERKPFDDNRKPFAVNYAQDTQADANLHLVVSMDGKALQIFLNEHCQEFDLMRNDVLVALGYSSDPAKLVLDAMQGFYPPHLKNGDKEFETEVVRRTCILLLEQLMKISPVIRPPVKKEAMRLARDWITKMKTDAEHSLEVLAFLHLLASYGLASTFDANELLTYMEIVAPCSQAPKLFRVLGFADRVYGFVRNLIENKYPIAAIRFIHAFELSKEIPPEPLLNDFLKDSRSLARKSRKADKSLDGQIGATDKRIYDLRQALQCVEECNTKCFSSPKQLTQMIDSLEGMNKRRKRELLLGPKMRNSHPNKKKNLASTFANRDISALDPATSSATSHTLVSTGENQPQQLSGNKRPRMEELAEKSSNMCQSDADQGDLLSTSMDISSPLDLQPNPKRVSVNTNKENSKLTQDGNIAADLQSAFDPGKLVLDVINICFPFKLEGNQNFKLHIPKKCCSLLLDQLRNEQFEIRPEVQEQARKFAIQWEYMQENKRSDPLDVNCFLQFLPAFKLASFFDAEKLLGLLLSLLDTEYWCKAAPELCRDLNLTKVIPSFIQKQTRRARHDEAIKFIYALTIVDSFPALPILKNHLINSSIAMQQGDKESEIKALKDAIKCISDFSITEVSPGNLRVRIAQLEREKAKHDKLKSVVKMEHQDKEKPRVNTPAGQGISTEPSVQQPKPVLPVSQGVQHGSTEPPKQPKPRVKTPAGRDISTEPSVQQPKPVLPMSQAVQHGSITEPPNSTQPAPPHQSSVPANPPSHSAPLRPCTSVQLPQVSFTLQGHCQTTQPPLPPYPQPPSQQPQPGLYVGPGNPYMNAAPRPGPYGSMQPPQPLMPYQPGWYIGQAGSSLYNSPHFQQYWNYYNVPAP